MMSGVPEISGGVPVNFGPVVGGGFDEITDFSKHRRPDSVNQNRTDLRAPIFSLSLVVREYKLRRPQIVCGDFYRYVWQRDHLDGVTERLLRFLHLTEFEKRVHFVKLIRLRFEDWEVQMMQ
jgi:hypothetical protein